ncbi:MAG: hypothetical protein IPP06_12575 [Saprospiraceae bacterium]|nr:hypothetical protein [Candidatus Vicinibacter affinis]MBP6522053.1 hypothetical protein [Saprospiraceae bacterium]MBK7302434.1 hypothetical protein [Candidatus Vicinibacter affinis]MBK7695754.1 hypothetical protein [Candidatus Vicinibacter affinis]MBK8404174.1 hypothetical protein [Candidatus Vicinibacter affinis]
MFIIFILLLLTSCQKPTTAIYVNEHSQLIFQKNDSLFISSFPLGFIKINNFSNPKTIKVHSTDIGCDDLEGDTYNIELTISKMNNSFLLQFNDTCAENSNHSGEYSQLILEPIKWDSLKIHFVHSEEYDVIVHRDNIKKLSNNSNLLDFDSEILLFFNDKLNNDKRYTRSIEVPEIIMFHKGLVIKKKRRGYIPNYLSNIKKLSYSKFNYN